MATNQDFYDQFAEFEPEDGCFAAPRGKVPAAKKKPAIRRIKGASGDLYDPKSKAHRLALDLLADLLREIGFVVERHKDETTLRVYPTKRHQYPLLNPGFERWADGSEFLEFTVYSRGDKSKSGIMPCDRDTLDQHLKTFTSDHGCFTDRLVPAGEYCRHGNFNFLLRFKANKIDFKALGKPLRDLWKFLDKRNYFNPDECSMTGFPTEHFKYDKADNCFFATTTELGVSPTHIPWVQRMYHSNPLPVGICLRSEKTGDVRRFVLASTTKYKSGPHKGQLESWLFYCTLHPNLPIKTKLKVLILADFTGRNPKNEQRLFGGLNGGPLAKTKTSYFIDSTRKNGCVKIKGRWVRAVGLDDVKKFGWVRWQGLPTRTMLKAMKDQPATKIREMFPDLLERKNFSCYL